jgi:hypothetical protein
MDMKSCLRFLGNLCIRGSKLRSRVLYDESTSNDNRSKRDSNVISIFDDQWVRIYILFRDCGEYSKCIFCMAPSVSSVRASPTTA